MKLSSRIITTAAVAVVLMPTLLLRAAEAAKPTTNDDQASSAASQPTAMPYTNGMNRGTPKVELFMGYSYLRAMPELAAGNRMVHLHGGSTSIAFNFNRYLGLVGDFGGFNDKWLLLTGAGENPSVNAENAGGSVFTYLAGPRLSFRNHGRFTPYVQALFGGMHASDIALCKTGCVLLPVENTFAMTAGGGLDIRVRRHLAIRIVQAEYLMTRFDNSNTGSREMQNDMRLSSGIVFRFGGRSAPAAPALGPLAYSCSVTPSAAYPGDSIAASGTALNLSPVKTAVYTWSVDGGTVVGVSDTAKIDTTNVAVGAYALKGHVSEGDKPSENADCTAPYVVKAYEPPTVSCSANPSTVISGDPSTITATGISPQNRPLTYSYSSASGSVSGSGTTATLSTAGAPVGPDTATCNVVDDKGQTATANTSVTITAPPPPAEQVRLEARLALHSIFFPTDQPRIGNPNGGLVASQEGTLTTLATDFKGYLTFKPDAHLTLSGHADVRGSIEYNQLLSDRRVARTKLYLVEQGVPEASIETRGLGKEEQLTADQVKELVEQNQELSAVEREKVLRDLTVIVLAQNRRVDVTLSTTGQQSVRLYPFNAADALTLLDQRNLTHKK